MKYPVSDKIINSADKYANLSLQHTHDWKGFENDKTKNKKNRIKIGKIAEYWTAEYCYKSGTAYKLDMTSYTQSDDNDILITAAISCRHPRKYTFSSMSSSFAMSFK